MSPSMWTWRVILPAFGLAACSLVLWPSRKPEGDRAASTLEAQAARPQAVRVIAEGRITARPGAQVTVGDESGGMVASVTAVEHANVRKGDPLLEFRAVERNFDLTEAEAKLAEADAELSFCLAEHQRKVQGKPKPEVSSPTELDASRRDVQVAVARRKAAEVAVDRARAALARTRLTAPIDGQVIALAIEPGEIAAPGARLVTICDLSRLWIEAEVDEFDVARVKLGDEVVIKAEGYDETWSGTVEAIPDRVAARTLTPDDPGRSADTRVLLVKIALKQPLPLKLGQQVEVEIHVRP